LPTSPTFRARLAGWGTISWPPSYWYNHLVADLWQKLWIGKPPHVGATETGLIFYGFLTDPAHSRCALSRLLRVAPTISYLGVIRLWWAIVRPQPIPRLESRDNTCRTGPPGISAGAGASTGAQDRAAEQARCTCRPKLSATGDVDGRRIPRRQNRRAEAGRDPDHNAWTTTVAGCCFPDVHEMVADARVAKEA